MRISDINRTVMLSEQFYDDFDKNALIESLQPQQVVVVDTEMLTESQLLTFNKKYRDILVEQANNTEEYIQNKYDMTHSEYVWAQVNES